MDYFVMSQDKRLLNVAKLKLPDSFYSRSSAYNQGESTVKTKIIYVEKGSRIEYPDYFDAPIMLICEKFKRMISKYQADITFDTVVLIEKESGRQQVYYWMKVPEISCASEETSYDKSGNVVEFVLDEEKVGHTRIFCASNYRNKLLVRLDVAESILRRESYGIWFNQMKIARKDRDDVRSNGQNDGSSGGKGHR